MTSALTFIMGLAFGAGLFATALVMLSDLRARRESDRRWARAVSGAVTTPRSGGKVVSIREARELRGRRIA